MFDIVIATDRESGRYGRKEPICFKPSLRREGKALSEGKARYAVYHDRETAAETGEIDFGAKAPEIIVAGLDAPGFVQCEVSFTPEDGSAPVTARLGAAVEPEAIRPGSERPDDFDAFWDEKKKALEEVPATVISKHAIACDFVELYDIRVKCLGAAVSGYLAKPCGATGKLPAMVHFQGAGVKTAFLDPPILWATRGFLGLCVNAHGIPNGQPAEFYDSLAAGALAGYPNRDAEYRDKYYMLGVCLRVKRALDFIMAQPEWDGKNLLLNGHSQGAFQTIAGAYLEPRVTAFTAGVPAGCDHGGALVGRPNGWPRLDVAAADPTRDRGKILNSARYFDNAHFLKGVKDRPAIFSVGWIDQACRPTSVYAAYNSFDGPKKMLDRPAMVHGAPKDVRDAFTAFLLDLVQP